MRRALISDIHGNIVALETVLRDCRAAGVEEILCLGDLCGFGPDIVECIDLVRAECAWSLLGDHEARLFGQEFWDKFNNTARQSMMREISALRPSWYSFPMKRSRWKWLSNLVPEKVYAGALFVHATPSDPAYEFLSADDFFPSRNNNAVRVMNSFEGLCFAGHTHRPGTVLDEGGWLRPHERDVIQYDSGSKLFVNVGSVGQPRDTDPRSCYVIWDDEARTVAYRRVAYDLAAVKIRFEALPGIHGRYFERLVKGV